MSLELVGRQTLWSATALDIGAVANYTDGVHFWWDTANGITSNANVPAVAWHAIDVSAADKLYICYAGIVNTVTGTDTVTTSGVRAEAIGVLAGQGLATGQLSSAFAGLGGTLSALAPALDGEKLLIQSSSGDTIAVFPNISTWGAVLHEHGLVHGDSTAVAATDRVNWRLEIGANTLVKSTTNTGGIGGLNVSAFDTVYLAVKTFSVVATIDAEIDITSYTGEMAALTYQEVSNTRSINKRHTLRRDKF